MGNLRDIREMDKIAEKIALDDFDKSNEPHDFSDTYTRKKNIFMEEIKKKDGQPQGKRKISRFLIAVACLLIYIPTTAFGAAKLYEMFIDKQNYEVNIAVENKDSKEQKWYRLNLDYLPNNMEEVKHADMKYSFKDHYAEGGFSFILWRLDKNSDFKTLYSSSYEEKEINGRKAIIVKKGSGNENMMFDREVFLLFEDEGIMLEGYIGADVNENLLTKVLKGISLQPTSKEKASFIMENNEENANEEDEQAEIKVIPLKKDSKQLYSIGSKFPVTIDQISKLDRLEYTVEKAEVFDNIKHFKQENFREKNHERLMKYKALDASKNLLPYKRNVYQLGNGKESIDKLIESKKVNTKFIYLTTTIKNVGDEETEEIYMHPSLQVLKQVKEGWNYAEQTDISEHSIMYGEVDYLDPHGSGAFYYNIGRIQPGQTKRVKLGYFVDEDKLDSIFLDVFHYTGVHEIENLNAKDRWWIDIRQK